MKAKVTQKEIVDAFRRHDYKDAIVLLASLEPAEKVENPYGAAESVKKWAGKSQEHFMVITLDAANYLIESHLVFVGTLNKTVVHPRELFKHAIMDNAAAIIIAHNHPSGNVMHSSDDKEVFQRMKEAGRIMRIDVLDSLVIGIRGGNFVWESLVEQGGL